MNAVLENVLLLVIKQLLTDELVMKLKVQMVEGLKKLALESDNRVDDYVVEVVAEALGVVLPK